VSHEAAATVASTVGLGTHDLCCPHGHASDESVTNPGCDVCLPLSTACLVALCISTLAFVLHTALLHHELTYHTATVQQAPNGSINVTLCDWNSAEPCQLSTFPPPNATSAGETAHERTETKQRGFQETTLLEAACKEPGRDVVRDSRPSNGVWHTRHGHAHSHADTHTPRGGVVPIRSKPPHGEFHLHRERLCVIEHVAQAGSACEGNAVVRDCQVCAMSAPHVQNSLYLRT
jgi:hypothetical protein